MAVNVVAGDRACFIAGQNVTGMTTRLTRYGFWSYARKDDARSDRRVSQLHDLIQEELELASGKAVLIFQDTSAITKGAVWEAKIAKAIAESSFLIPILTPVFLQRPWCFREVRMFLDRERDLHKQHPELREESLIFPIGYREVLDEEALDPEIMAILRSRQWTHIEAMLDREIRDQQLVGEVRGLVHDILKLLRIPIETETERSEREDREQAAAEARERGEASRAAEAAAHRRALTEEHGRNEGTGSGGPVRSRAALRRATAAVILLGAMVMIFAIAIYAVVASRTPSPTPEIEGFPTANLAKYPSEPNAEPTDDTAVTESAVNALGDLPTIRPGNSGRVTERTPLRERRITRASPQLAGRSPQPPPGNGPVTIQLGAFASSSFAESAWAALAGRFRYLASLSHSVVVSPVGGRNLYRLRAQGPGADEVCRRLRVAGEACSTVD